MNFSNVNITPKLNKNYLDCFNKAICDIGTISDLLPSLIILPEKSTIVNKKIAAAEVAFASTWKEPQVITKEVDSDDESINLHWDNQNESMYDDPNGCTHAELKQLQLAILECLPLTLGFHPGNGAKSLCWCPCSKYMKGWRDKTQVNGPEKPCDKGKMTSSALIQHLEDKKRCVYHRYISKYLKVNFCVDEGEYLGMGVGHYSFYGKSDRRRQKSYDNEMEFLKYKKEYDLKRREEKQKKADELIKMKLIKEAETKVIASEPDKLLNDKQTSELENKPHATVVSSLTDENIYSPHNSMRKQRRHRLQRQNRKNKQALEECKYKKILVLGTSHGNLFLDEYESRVNDKSSLTHYTTANGKLFPSKDVSDAIRGYHYSKHLPNIDIISEKYSLFKNMRDFTKLKKQCDEDGIDAIFIDYFQMADNVYLDELTVKIKDRITVLIADRACDIVFPFSKCLLEYFHSSVEMKQYDVSVLTEETVTKQNHPLFFVDEHNKTQEVMNQYHFNADASFSAIGQLTKETILDTWDHPNIGVDVLDYLDNIEDNTPIYFIVLSKEAAVQDVMQEENEILVTDEKNTEEKLVQVNDTAGKTKRGANHNPRKSKSSKKKFPYIYFASHLFVVVI